MNNFFVFSLVNEFMIRFEDQGHLLFLHPL